LISKSPPVCLFVAERNDLFYYDTVTNTEGPAMTWALFAMGWSDIGEHEKANTLFKRGYANARPPFQVWTEVADAPAVFPSSQEPAAFYNRS
jgi:hypothetical protein